MTWAMWAYGTLVLVAIEAHIGVPISALILPIVCMLCSIGVAAYAFASGVHIPPERQDWIALGLDATLMIGYAAAVIAAPASGAPVAFVALAGASPLVSSWPILRTTYMAPENERPLAWFVWSAAYGLLTLAIMAEGMAWPFLIYPALAFVTNLLIGIFAIQPQESFGAEGQAR